MRVALLLALALPLCAAECRWSWRPKQLACALRCYARLGHCTDRKRSPTIQDQAAIVPAVEQVAEENAPVLVPAGALLGILLGLLAATGVLLRGKREQRRQSLKPLQVGLWEGRAHPCMRIFLPSGASSSTPRPAFVVFRGGGWYSCMGSGEGTAEWAAMNGMVGVEVEYAAAIGGQPMNGKAQGSVLAPLPEGAAAYPQCLADVCRAVRLLRKQGSEGKLPIDPRRVAVCGFSAGGHLAGLLAALHDTPLTASAEDDLSRTTSCRPDRVVLCYPVTLLNHVNDPEKLTNAFVNVLGVEGCRDHRLRAQLSPALHVNSSTPPLFIWCTADDPLVPSAHSTIMFEAARNAGIPAELHVYADAIKGGAHAQGLAADNPSISGWTDQCLAWLGPGWVK